MPGARLIKAMRDERGSALADFALVSVILVPLFFAILQLALIWHVKTTLTAAASQGARYGAAYERTATDGADRTRSVVEDVFGPRLQDQVWADESTTNRQVMVEVTVRAQVPVVAFWGPTITVQVSGHAVRELLP